MLIYSIDNPSLICWPLSYLQDGIHLSRPLVGSRNLRLRRQPERRPCPPLS